MSHFIYQMHKHTDISKWNKTVSCLLAYTTAHTLLRVNQDLSVCQDLKLQVHFLEKVLLKITLLFICSICTYSRGMILFLKKLPYLLCVLQCAVSTDHWEQYIASVVSLMLRKWERLSEGLVREVQLENVWVSLRTTNRGRDRPDQTPGPADRGSRTPGQCDFLFFLLY